MVCVCVSVSVCTISFIIWLQKWDEKSIKNVIYMEIIAERESEEKEMWRINNQSILSRKKQQQIRQKGKQIKN